MHQIWPGVEKVRTCILGMTEQHPEGSEEGLCFQNILDSFPERQCNEKL
jgi:hypothetical protein